MSHSLLYGGHLTSVNVFQVTVLQIHLHLKGQILVNQCPVQRLRNKEKRTLQTIQ